MCISVIAHQNQQRLKPSTSKSTAPKASPSNPSSLSRARPQGTAEASSSIAPNGAASVKEQTLLSGKQHRFSGIRRGKEREGEERLQGDDWKRRTHHSCGQAADEWLFS
jgi:hypothetical protein